MGNIRNFLKRQALTRLPNGWLHLLRRLHYERTVRTFSERDEPDLCVVRHLIEPGTTAIDLGANIGAYTRILSSLTGPAGRVIAVEPVRETFGYLQRNARVFQMSNVALVNAAISDVDGAVTIEVPQNEFGGPYFTRARVVGNETRQTVTARRVVVPSHSLDHVAVGAGRIAFIKCDIEGHELQCLAGAQAVIADYHPAWLIEVWGDPDEPDSRASLAFATLQAHGYGGWYFDGRVLRRRRVGDRSVNYFFLTASHLARLRDVAPHLLV